LKRPKKKALADAPAPRTATLPKVVLVASGMLLMFLLESLFWPGHGLAWRQAKNAKTAASLASSNFLWGAPINYVPIALDRPEEYFTNDFIRGPATRWVFRNQGETELASLFSTLELTDSTRTWLNDRAHWETSANIVRIKPPPEVVVSLAPETRARLYAMLARDPENVPHATPFRFRADGFNDWFAECGLPPEKIALVRKLTYRQEGNLCFADAATFAEISSAEETKCLVRGLWRVSTFVMKLRVDPSTDVSVIIKYWGLLGPAYTYKPFIESVARVPEGSEINISYFLPPFARLRLYTYPNPSDPNIVRQDCFWSSMNFFNSAPDDGFFNPDHTRKVLKSDYTRNPAGPRQFGDLLLLLGRGEEALHMCVHIADDVVFTKNGANTQQPWVLMKLPEMLGSYETLKPFQIVTYRRKTPRTNSLVISSAASAL